jgi:hypothetical protein
LFIFVLLSALLISTLCLQSVDGNFFMYQPI